MSGSGEVEDLLFDLREVERTWLFPISIGGKKVFVDEFLVLSTKIASLDELLSALDVFHSGCSGSDLSKVCATLLFVTLRFDRFALFKIIIQESSKTLDIANLLDIDGKNLMMYAAEYLSVCEESCEALHLLHALGSNPQCVAKGGYTLLHAAIFSLRSKLVKWCLEDQKMTMSSFTPAAKYDSALKGLHLLHDEESLSVLEGSVDPVSWAIAGAVHLLVHLRDDNGEISKAVVEIFDHLLRTLEYCGGFNALKPQGELLLLITCACILEKVMGSSMRSILGSISLSSRMEDGNKIERLIPMLREMIATEDTLNARLKRDVVVGVAMMLDALLSNPVVSSSAIFFMITHDMALLLRQLIDYKRSVVEHCLARHGTRILMAAACNGYADVVSALLEVVDINESIDGYTAFMLASAGGCVSVVHDFLERIKDAGDEFCVTTIDTRDALGRNAFLLAAMNDQASVIREFLTTFGAEK